MVAPSDPGMIATRSPTVVGKWGHRLLQRARLIRNEQDGTNDMTISKVGRGGGELRAVNPGPFADVLGGVPEPGAGGHPRSHPWTPSVVHNLICPPWPDLVPAVQHRRGVLRALHGNHVL